MLLGKNENNENNAVIIELKQWQEALKTDEDAVVKTFLNENCKRQYIHHIKHIHI